MKKLKIKLITKILMAFTLTSLALVSTKNTSFAMQTENIPSEATRLPSDQIESQAHKNAKKFLKWAEQKNIDLKTARIVVVENGGNYDLEDNISNYLNCTLNGKKVNLKVNLGLDQLKCKTINYLNNQNESNNADILKTIGSTTNSTTNSTKDPIKNLMIPISVNPATPTAENVNNDFYTILDPIPESKIGQYNFGAKYYGTNDQTLALKIFLEDISKEIGYKINENVMLIYLMINECGEHNGTGLEIYYHPSNEKNAALAEEIYKNCETLKNKNRYNPVKGNTLKRIPKATNDMEITGILSFNGFGDNEKDQKKILDPNSLEKIAMEYAYTIATWLNYNPEYACITIEPANDPNNFIVKAHIKNFKESNINKRMIIIGRADLDENQWNKNKNEKLLDVTETARDKEIMRTFNPLTDGALQQINDCKYDENIYKLNGHNNKFYIRICDSEGRQILSNVTNFRLVEPKNAITNSFTRFDI